MRKPSGPLVALLLVLAASAAEPSGRRVAAGTSSPPATPPASRRPSEVLRERVAQLPPAPEGVTDLYFDEFFVMPVGPRGLRFTERLSSLDGKRVRLLGHMVKQGRPTPWTLLLAPLPLVTREKDYALAEDLPPNVVRVLLPRSHKPVTPYTPGHLLLTGRLEIGDREEADGRHSLVRLHLDPQAVESAASPGARGLATPGNSLSAPAEKPARDGDGPATAPAQSTQTPNPK